MSNEFSSKFHSEEGGKVKNTCESSLEGLVEYRTFVYQYCCLPLSMGDKYLGWASGNSLSSKTFLMFGGWFKNAFLLRRRQGPEEGGGIAVHPSSSESKECFLLARLPVEIRLQIYEYYFEPTIISLQRYAVIKSCGSQASSPHPQRIHDPFSLLKTCNQIYNEARTLAYASLIFHLQYENMNAFLDTANVLPLESFAIVRSLYVSCGPDPWTFAVAPGYGLTAQDMRVLRENREAWKVFWAFVEASMPNLVHLWGIVTMARPHVENLPLALDAEWVQPLLRISGLEHLTFRVPGHDRSKFLEELLRQRLCKPGSYGQTGTYSAAWDMW
jgi:hypothetical protein